MRIENAQTGEDREVLIYMNHPLRYEGLTFFQHQMGADEAWVKEGRPVFSTLQVVQNPSWLTPYISCTLVGLGLLVQFLTHLMGFAKRRRHQLGVSRGHPSDPKPRSQPQSSVKVS